MNTELSEKQIIEQYELIKNITETILRNIMLLPNLYSGRKFTKNALVLVYLSIGYPKTKVISKTELTAFIRKFYPEVNDVQQARHLGAQDGWWIVAGGKG